MTNLLSRPLQHVIIFGSIFLFAFLVWSATMARQNSSNRVEDWLPEGSKEMNDFYDYYKRFPEGELLMVSWKNCNRHDERLDEVAAQLSSPAPGQEQPYFKRVLTTRSVLRQMTAPPLRLTAPQARRRMTGWMIGKNKEDACLVALISTWGEQNRTEAIQYVFQTVEEIVRQPASDIYIAGPTIDSVAIDTISAQSQRTLLPLFLLLCFVMLLCCLKNFFAAFILFAVALMNEELGGTLLYWTGAHVDSISMLISSLVYVLTLSGGVHFINYYRETLRETDGHNAPWRTLKKAFLPCSLAVITTVLGFVSLSNSGMIPIQTFGRYASVSLLIGTAWLFIFLYAVLQQYPIRRWQNSRNEQNTAQESKYWNGLGYYVHRYRNIISIVALLLMGVLCIGVTKLKTTVTFHGMFLKSSKVIQDYEKLENMIGGLIPVEVLLRVPQKENEYTDLVFQLYLLQELRKELSQIEGVDAVLSALNFVPNLPLQTEWPIWDTFWQMVVNFLIHKNQDQIESTGFYIRPETKNAEKPVIEGSDEISATEKDEEHSAWYWRLSLRTPSYYPGEYSTLLASVNDRLESVRQTENGMMFKNIHFTVTGGVPVVHRAQKQLLSDLITSFISAFGLIAVTMILLFRGVGRGLLAMVPNLFPCVIVFGMLGWLSIPIDMGTMMTVSVAMGIAVDGTLHYLTWFNIGLKRGMTRQQAVQFSYNNCATALLQTTIICGVGMLVFSVSAFVPVSRFATLLCILLMVALIGDIIVLPALLLSPIGRMFKQRCD